MNLIPERFSMAWPVGALEGRLNYLQLIEHLSTLASLEIKRTPPPRQQHLTIQQPAPRQHIYTESVLSEVTEDTEDISHTNLEITLTLTKPLQVGGF